MQLHFNKLSEKLTYKKNLFYPIFLSDSLELLNANFLLFQKVLIPLPLATQDLRHPSDTL